MLETQERDYLIYGGAALAVVVAAILLIRSQGGGTSPGDLTFSAVGSAGPSQSAITATENADNYTLATATEASNTLLAYLTQKNALTTGLAQITAQSTAQYEADQTQEEIATTQANAQVQTSSIQSQTAEYAANLASASATAQYNAQETIAADQVSASEAQASAAESASKTASNDSIWGSIISGISSILGFFNGGGTSLISGSALTPAQNEQVANQSPDYSTANIGIPAVVTYSP
jgi:membrane protein involved in colicin uptake